MTGAADRPADLLHAIALRVEAARRLSPPAGTAVLLVAAGCSSEDEPTVGTGTVGTGEVAEVVDAAGQVQPRASSVIKAPAAGTVATLLVNDGDQVEAG